MTEILHSVEFQMTFLLFVALAGHLLASRINQSSTIGQILVGLLVGPSVLGLVTYTDFVRSLAQIGAIFLLFVVGMEFKLRDIARPRYLLIAGVGVVVPWAAGYGTALLFGSSLNAALFAGTALTATSIAITAGVLREMGRLDTEASRAIIGAAVIDDVLGLLVLAVSTGIVGGSFSLASVALVFVKAAAFLVVGAAAGLLGLRRLLILIDGTRFTKRSPEVTFIFAAMVAFLYGVAAEMLGLSAIVGAFIAGTSLGGLELRNGRDLTHGSESITAVFASIFFISLGVLADVRSVDGRVLLFIAALTIVAVLSKLAGCGGSALLTGSRLREAAIVGFGMSPRGEVAMIIALIGLDRRIIGQDIFVSLIVMSLITTMLTPLVLRPLLFGERRTASATR